uniref:Polycystic kidney disease 1a n=1 Tax=Amphiprion ocellaris TaxID=80972 RepID=A0AAQ5YYB8_AMPOC
MLRFFIVIDLLCHSVCVLPSSSDLSSNPFDCDCKPFRLVSWLQEKGVRVRRPQAMLCNHPPELRHQPLLNVSLLTCLNYAACLEDSSSGGGGRSELVIFSSSTPGNFTREQCNSMCFGASHRYGGLGERHECLCSTNSRPNFISESQCSAACTNPHVMKVCISQCSKMINNALQNLIEFQVTSAEPSYPASASCPLRVVPPLGLTILHPPPRNNTLYLQPNDTRLLLRVQSSYETKMSRRGSNLSVTFQPECPPEFPVLCQPGLSSGSGVEVSEPSQYAMLDLSLGVNEQKVPVQIELEAHNNVTEASLMVFVHLEEPLRGLVVQPHPAHRVLMESVVSYTASVLEGTSPTFKWTVDDKPYFTYYNTVLNVIYQHAAIYKLTVTAMNHVSTLTEHFNVTVDRLQPMNNLTVRGVPDVVPQGSNQTLTASVLVDMSVAATFRWSFGDGGYKEFEYKPPYPLSLLWPDSPNQILLSNNITYVYSQPGIYTALVSVSNRYENISQSINMSVYSILTRVDIQTEPQLLLAGKSADFEAHPLPSPYGIHYDWHFGDGSATLQGRRVAHTCAQSGVFTVCVSVNNTISSTEACAEVFVYEEIEDLTAESSSPTELNSPTTVWAHLASGNNITWTFSMGDGTLYTTSEPRVSHSYVKDGNYTVNVTAMNAVSSGWTVLPVQVFVFQVIRMEPSGCVQERTPVNFQAWVSGNASIHLYEWSFGDGSLNETHHGNPRVSHTYQTSGNYQLSLLLSSRVNKATKDNFFNWVCVQPALTDISLILEKSHYAVGEEVKFHVRAEPQFNYSYQWDFGREEDLVPIHGSENIMTAYKKPGLYIVTVNVFNNISTSNTSAVIEVLMPIGPIVIHHNGTKYNNLTLGASYAFITYSLASNVTYIWNFGDGNVLTGKNTLHTYNISGNYNITLKAANTVSHNDTVLPVNVLTPIRGLTVNASLVNVPLNASVHFEAQMEEGDCVRFSWMVSGSLGYCCTSIPGTHTMFYTFRSVGTFNIIVTAENDVGTSQASIILFVQRELEGLQILADEIGGGGGTGLDGCCYATNRVLHLQAGLKEGTNMTFTWNLIRELDPVSSFNVTGKTVELNFSKPGPCDILLRAANLLGQLSINRTIHFLEPAGSVQLQISNNPAAVGSSTNMTVQTNGGTDLQYRWTIDGNTLDWNKPWKTHNFNSPGQKQVTVEVFNEVSSEVVSEIVSVQEVISGLSFSATNVTEQNYVATGVNVLLQGDVLTGTNVVWTWLMEGRTETGRKTSLIFQEPKTASVTLNATNDVSCQVVSREFFVQDKIQGLELRASKKRAAVDEKVEFTITMVAGTDVQLILSISGDATMYPQPNTTYSHVFTRVDSYLVNLTAHNQRHHLQVEVMEPVRGLSIQGSCAAIPVGVKKVFVANIQTGKPVRFLWTFDLHLHKASHMGKEVPYTPEEPGLLTIYLRALNNLHGQNITRHILVQHLLKAAVLDAVPRDTFINKTVTLMASVTPRSSPVECLWDFGDGSTQVHTNTTTVGYAYRHPGHYLVQVNCSNLVSWVLAQVEVNISVLECEEPEVQVVQAPRLAIWRYQPALVEASVDLKGCIRYGAQYLWQVLAGAVTQPSQFLPVQVIRLPGEVDVRRLQLSLPKMALTAGNYTLVFSLSYEGVPLRKAACLHLGVMAARLMPIIEGGTYRVWPRTQDLQLSAEQSYDPNMDPDSQSLLNYNWECQSTSKHCSSLNFGLGSSGPVLGISGSELEAEVEYTFKLTISKDGMAPESTTQTVLVQSGHIPMVYLECVSCKAQSIYEVSQNSYVYLKGTCTNCQGLHRGRWSAMTLQNETLVLDFSSTTTGSDGMNLVLRQGVLRQRVSYIFTLHVTDSSLDGEGVASITLHHNNPPAGGKCHLRVGGEAGVDDLGVSETPLLYSLLVTRCREDYCEDFCVYKGSSPEHSAFLPPGFRPARHRVAVSITVEDHQGAAVTALNNSIEVVQPDPPPEYSSLPHWLSELTDTKLKKLLEQGDSQRVRELSLVLITVLNETKDPSQVSREERNYRVRVRSNITRALTALDLTTVSDIQQTSAALAQCTVSRTRFICEECQNSTLNKLESMLEILQTDTKQGTVTPTEIADNILNIMGDLIHQVSQSDHGNTLLDASPSSPEPHPLRVAAKAYSLSSVLMLILMHARVLNEEPLVLRGAEIAATGKLADPHSLLCYHGNNSPECQRFSIPRAFNKSLGRAAAGNSIMQLLFQVESNPFPFNYVANYTVSTEVASMEFRTENGTQIPISGLDDSLAITVAINNGSSGEVGTEGSGTGGVPAAGAVNISHCDSVVVRVSTGNSNRQAGLFVQLNFTSLEVYEEEPYITAYLHSHEQPNEFNCTDKKLVTLSMTRGQDLDHRKYTFFLSPKSRPVGVRLEVGVFASLCQYFSENEKQWRTDGMVPLAETNSSRAVCRTRHLTAFAASLFVPANAISFKVPERSGAPSLVVLLVCILGLLSYAVAAAILHKLDQLDLRRAGVVPLCGRDGLFKYEVQVKTGWSRGAGTTAHVGISLYGRESRSGHRHLDSRGAFARNALDIFHIATDASLGSVWKIRVWHDNKGLSPAWLLQYVLVKDLQTGSSFYFLVEEWLSVDNERTDGRVEIEVEASEEAALRQLPRLLRCELQRALCESHLWLSLWERPPRSPFTRLQRATCCAVLLQLFLLANTLWYSIVVDKSPRAVSRISSLNGETVAAGVVTCLIIYPFYLLVFTLFRMSRSKVPPQVDQESVEIDDFLDNSMAGSSFLFFNGEVGSLKETQRFKLFFLCSISGLRFLPSVVTDVCRPRRFPPWCGRAALWGSWAGITLANSVSIWAGHGFNQSVAMMWLISCFASFLCSCLLLEPIKVLCETAYYALCVRRLRPEDQDVLVEFPRVERVVLRVSRVRPPQGFALSQARHQARKVHMLHTMLKNFLVYMFFLLVVLLLNYSDSAKDTHSLRLRTQLQQALHTPEYHNISRYTHRHTPNNRPYLNVLWWFEKYLKVTKTGRNCVKYFDLISCFKCCVCMCAHRTRAVFVEFSLYNINTNLLAVFSFLFEFPVSERAQSSFDLLVITLWPITGLDLQLLLMMVLLALVVYFLVRGILGFLREGYRYLLSTWRLLGICKLSLAASVCGLHLSRCIMAKQQWASYMKHPRDAFTDFYPLARQSQMYTVMSALLLFILVLKASHQLRFLREWAVFGRALRRSVWELLGVAVALLLLLLAYSHAGHLLFHSVLDGYGSVTSACLSLVGAGGRGLLSWRPAWTLTGPSSTVSSLVFRVSFAILRLVLLWLVTSLLLRNYRRARAELYRPAVDLQDYEMVELFLRRLKMWMGLSRTKEVLQQFGL